MIALSGTFRRPAHAILIAFLAAVALGFGTVAVAQEEDITDNEVCLECHADTDRSEPKESDKPRVHADDGSFLVEDHDMWSCVDCHMAVTELPHPDDYTWTEVDCLECHDEVPEG
jgi:hypothetical protein